MTDGGVASRPRLVLAVLALGCAAYAMLQSLVVPALPTLQHDLGTTPTGVTWVFTAYLLSASVATPIVGRLGDMFGKKRTLLVVLAGLGGGSLVAALATTLPVLIAARTIQSAARFSRSPSESSATSFRASAWPAGSHSSQVCSG